MKHATSGQLSGSNYATARGVDSKRRRSQKDTYRGAKLHIRKHAVQKSHYKQTKSK